MGRTAADREGWSGGMTEVGKPAVMIEEDALCPDCGKVHDIEACPDCGSDIFLGFGLMFGGYGRYKGCEAGCGWFWKRSEEIHLSPTTSAVETEGET